MSEWPTWLGALLTFITIASLLGLGTVTAMGSRNKGLLSLTEREVEARDKVIERLRAEAADCLAACIKHQAELDAALQRIGYLGDMVSGTSAVKDLGQLVAQHFSLVTERLGSIEEKIA